MELNNILGNFRRVDTNWCPITPDGEVAVELRSPKHWIEDYSKMVGKYSDGAVTKEIKTVGGSNRKITVNKPKQITEKVVDAEKDKAFTEDTKKFLINNVIVNWRNIEVDGQPVEFSKENAEKVFDLSRQGMTELITSIMVVSLDINNFSENSYYNPEDDESIKK